MSLEKMIRDTRVPIDEICAFLDALPPKYRLSAIYDLPSSLLGPLYEKAASSAPVSLSFYVPEGRPPLTEVIHHGRNTLPVFQRFQKVFCKPSQGSETQLIGYNQSGLASKLIGPGYYVAYETTRGTDWNRLGSVVIDYFQIPTGEVAPGWPPIQPNSQGLQAFVYHRTRDFMRRVSSHVSIGAAWKDKKALGVFFILCREGA